MIGLHPGSHEEDQGDPLPWLTTTTPNMARFYDAMLCGKDNFAADRALAHEVSTEVPAMPRLLRQNRRFVTQAVARMADEGITQFLDLGCGLPTIDNTHQVARRRTSQARVVYVDRDPTVAAHGRAVLADDCRTVVVRADVRDHDAVFEAYETQYVLDLSRPVGVVCTALLHHIHDDDDPHHLIRTYLDRLPSGSMLAVSHFRAPGTGGPLDDQARAAERLLLRGLGSGWFRSQATIAAFFDGLTLDESGIRPLGPWSGHDHPDQAGTALALCGVARKR